VSLGTEQVHIAFQGYERERVYRPPIESNADKVILIAHNRETASNSEESAEESIDEDISKGRACRDEVRRKLEEEDIDVEITECDFFDLNSAVLGAGM